MKVLKYALLVFLSLFMQGSLSAQIIADPATWTVEAKKIEGNKYHIIFQVTIKDPWYIYTLKPGGGGTPTPTVIKFDSDPDIKLNGIIKEAGKIVTDKDENDVPYYYIQQEATYTQVVTIAHNTTIKGSYEYQTCNHGMCLKAKKKHFNLEITDAGAGIDTTVKAAANATPDTSHKAAAMASAVDTTNKTNKTKGAIAAAVHEKDAKNKEQNKSLIWLFFASLLGGLLAVLTPCVYSMIPITVSFFTKRSKTRAEGIRHAIQYSLSIIIIFTVLGVLISAFFGSNALNNLSTNWIANLFFFFIFILFGISFLGAFEITLPSSWTNKTDSKAGLGSFGGIFFMALTLVIVSFSCTGPIVGPLLVLAGRGGIVGPALGMFGFSVGLALPFALFAVFPGMLNKMATSGGWLNQVKVVLGFIELALALKFLSNADLAKGWRLLDREVFIAIWVVLSILLGLYLMGKFKMSHDDAAPKNIYGQEYVSIFKLFLAISCFSFAVYLVPGMWGAPLNAMSAFVPPLGTQDFVLGGNTNEGAPGPGVASKVPGDMPIEPLRYVNELKIYEPEIMRKYGLVTYYDYDEALAASKKLKKPVMLDFTGINCVNCRKMEGQVWSSPEVMKRLKNDFIIASLYCDYDKMELPANEQHFSKALQSQVVTVGDKNEELQASKFNANSQPYYFYVDEDGNKLVEEGYSYDPDVNKFIKHLDQVLANYKETHH